MSASAHIPRASEQVYADNVQLPGDDVQVIGRVELRERLPTEPLRPGLLTLADAGSSRSESARPSLSGLFAL